MTRCGVHLTVGFVRDMSIRFRKRHVDFWNDTMRSADHKMWSAYGVATLSRLLKIIGLFCRISSVL